MTTRLYLIRHGATTLSAEDRFSGGTEIDLSDEGRWEMMHRRRSRRSTRRNTQSGRRTFYICAAGRRVRGDGDGTHGYRHRLNQSPACLNILDFKDPVRARLMLFNDVSHYVDQPPYSEKRLSNWFDLTGGEEAGKS